MTQPETLNLSRMHRSLVFFVIALGGFAIGTNKYAAKGLLPEISKDLFAGVAKEIADAQTVLFQSFYAAGVVVGAIVLALLSLRFSRTRLIFVTVCI
ncbi:MAG: MFS transporter, partial [Microbacteriaceae bacterium]|nr:MFS transporter [Microbacteriaceae bacterium]